MLFPEVIFKWTQPGYFLFPSANPRKASDFPLWKHFAFTTVHYLEEKGGRHSPAALSDPVFSCLLTQIANWPIAPQQLDARGRAGNDLLKSPPSFRMGMRRDLIEFGCWCQMGRSTGTLTPAPPFLGSTEKWSQKEKLPSEQTAAWRKMP